MARLDYIRMVSINTASTVIVSQRHAKYQSPFHVHEECDEHISKNMLACPPEPPLLAAEHEGCRVPLRRCLKR